MKCSCGNEKATHVIIRYDKGERTEYCEVCGNMSLCSLPDVSAVHTPYFDEHLRDANNKNGTWITSRTQKAAVLKRLGLRENRDSKIKFYKDPERRRKYFRDITEG